MRNVSIASLAGICLLFVVTTGAANQLSSYFPDQITFGQSSAIVLSQHPKAVKATALLGSSPKDTGDFTLAELVINQNTRIAYWYYFKDDMLRGVGRTETIPLESNSSSTPKNVTNITAALQSNAHFLDETKVLRSNGLESFEVKAERWQENESDRNLYFLHTATELTLIAFDPAFLSKDQFFLSPSLKAKFDKNVAQVKKLLPKTPATNSEATPAAGNSPLPSSVNKITPASTPRPAASVLPKATAEIKSASGFPVVPVAILAVVVVAVIVFLLRRKSP